MTKHRFSEPEQFLIKNWADVTLFQRSIASISTKCDAICAEAIEAIQKKFPKLDASRVLSDSSPYGRQIGLGRTQWSSKWDNWPSGFWLSDIGLASLISEEEDPPSVTIWIRPASELVFDPVQARNRVRKEAKRLLSPDQLKRCRDDGDKWHCLWLPFPESRQRLLDLLLKEQAHEFVQCLVSNLEVVSKFIPIVDELLPVPNGSGRST